MIKVSVIVPVYNAEKYLNKCVDSILNQSLKDIEVILVDDGSTDGSLEVLRNYEKQDRRVKVLTQQNRFAGVARNNGLNVADGEYVIFWDSDDYFAENALESLYNEAIRCSADICVGEAVKMDANTGEVNKKIRYIHMKKVPEKRPFSVKDIPQYIFNFSNNFPWNKLYRKNFITLNDLKFKESRRANDTFFVMAAFVLAEKISIIQDVIVYYQFKNDDSLSVNANNNKEFVIGAFNDVREFLLKKGFWENEDIRRSFLNKMFSSISSQFAYSSEYDEFAELTDYYRHVLMDCNMQEFGSEDFYLARHYSEYNSLIHNETNKHLFSLYVIHRELAKENANKLISEKEKKKDKSKKKRLFSIDIKKGK